MRHTVGYGQNVITAGSEKLYANFFHESTARKNIVLTHYEIIKFSLPCSLHSSESGIKAAIQPFFKKITHREESLQEITVK